MIRHLAFPLLVASMSPLALAHGAHKSKPSGSSRELSAEPFYSLPAFELTDQNGQKFTLDTMRGKIAVVDFIFTVCGDDCPLMTQRMKSVRGDLAGSPNLIFVSITTDPKTDDPKTLKAYADKYKIDGSDWHFLTGDKRAIVDLSVKGFKLAANEATTDHTLNFVLVDAKGGVRGYYDSSDAAALKRLAVDVKKLK